MLGFICELKVEVKKNQKIVLTAMFLAIGHVLPFFTGQVPQIGKMLLPMHIPVLLCGLVCGARYGMLMGGILPLMRSLIWGIPMIYPTAVAMSLELATYGGIVGFLFQRVRRRCMVSLCGCILMAMIGGRIIWGITMLYCLSIGAEEFTFEAFMAGAFWNAIPGIVLQLVVVPSIILIRERKWLNISE